MLADFFEFLDDSLVRREFYSLFDFFWSRFSIGEEGLDKFNFEIQTLKQGLCVLS